MNRRRFYAPPTAFAADQSVALEAAEARHAQNVLRLKSGDELYVFDGAGKEYRCELIKFAREQASLKVLEEVAPARPESPLHFTLGVALLKWEKFDLVTQKATELGVHRIVPLETERADVRLRNKDDAGNRVTRWQRIAREAAKQCGRAVVPEILMPIGFDSWLMMSDSPLALMFSERDGQPLTRTLGDVRPTQLLAMTGPEGGWGDAEIEKAKAAGWSLVTLGGRTLRAETAAIAAATLIQARLGDLD